MTYAFAAAGTGGHVYPALAVARALVDRGVPAREIVFFGGDRLESTAVPEAGYELVRLDVRGLRRSLTLDNLRLPAVVRRAAANVATELTRRGPGVLTVFGGYVTVPAAMGARRVGMPYVIHEQNAVPGLANRYVARHADRVFVAFAAAHDRLPHADVVGNPLGPAFERYEREAIRPAALERYGLPPDVPVLGVFGGSQGARALNDVVPELVGRSEGRFAVLHLTGPDHYAAIAGAAAGNRLWRTAPFEPNMELFYGASDVVLSRAGAMTVSELAATGTAAVMVPLPAGKGYQARNAADLVAAGGAVVVDQSHIQDVPSLLTDIMNDDIRLRAMRRGAASIARSDAAARVADALQEITSV